MNKDVNELIIAYKYSNDANCKRVFFPRYKIFVRETIYDFNDWSQIDRRKHSSFPHSLGNLRTRLASNIKQRSGLPVVTTKK